jgi:hypothetical protein
MDMFNKNLRIARLSERRSLKPVQMRLDGNSAESDKAAMKTPFAICGICIIG